MRVCSACGKPDVPTLELGEACKPKQCSPTADERPETHHASCPRLAHTVVKLSRPAKLVATPAHPEGELERKWRLEGWTLMRDGRDVFRWKMLCRSCIEVVYEREEHHREYLKACKKARGDDDRTYSQLLTQQSFT
jgi:hypothetical protein